ncbi:MAG: hypothetical protein ACAI25_06865, partial [Planctomycetota bacterium]
MTAQKRSELRRQRHRAGSSEAEKLHKSARQGVFAALTIFALAAGARAEEPSPGAHCGGKTSKEWARVVADHKGTDKSKTPQQVTRALLALERIGADGPDAIPILGEVMKSAAYPGATHRAVADLLALHTSDRHSNEKATAALTAALLSGVESSRDAVFMSRVWRHDPVPPELIAAAAKLLSDEKNLVAAGAARSLESAGRSALSALAELRKALSRDFTRDEAARTLVAIGNPALVALPDMDAELARLVKVENEA